MQDTASEYRGSKAVAGIATHYAAELDAQFRTLNYFIVNSGEVGRAHETFLREVLRRFLPHSINLGSGFVAAETWTSRQQDILIYRRDGSVLLSVGDCVVVGDRDALIGSIEVKTRLKSPKRFSDCCAAMADLRERTGAFHALYVWDSAKCETALKGVWQYVRADPDRRRTTIPHVIYGKGKYLLMKPPVARADDPRSSAPYLRWQISEDGFTEGRALLGLVAAVFSLGSRPPGLPWWLKDDWDLHGGTAKDAGEPVTWPVDLCGPAGH
jgi:hypothetical protein